MIKIGILIQRIRAEVETLYFRVSLRNKLILVNTISIFIPIFVVFIFSIVLYMNIIESQLSDAKQQSLSQVSSSVDNYIREYASLSQVFNVNSNLRRAISAGIPSLKSYQDINQYLMNIISTHDEVLGVYIFSNNGLNYKLNRGHITRNLDDFQKQNWFLSAAYYAGQDMFFYSNLLDNYVNYDKPTLTYLKGISDPLTKEFLGALVLIFDTSKLDSILRSYIAEGSSSILITDESGRIIWHENPKFVNKLITNRFYFNSLLTAQEGFYQYNSADGRAIGFFFTTSAYSNWRIIELISMSQFRYYISLLNIYFISLIVIIIALLLYLTKVMSSEITRPIRDLTQAVTNFGNDLEFSSDIRSKDEIGTLNRSFMLMSQRIRTLINNVFTAQIKQKEAELNALQSKINPHFIYNSLEMISNIAEKNGVPEISSISNNLGDMLHYSLKSGIDTTTVREDLKYVRSYLAIQQMRFNNRFDVVFDLTSEALDSKILKLVIQPLVENSVTHGLEQFSEKGVLIISGERVGSSLVLRIIDNGCGMSAETLQTINNSFNAGENLFAQEELGNRGFALMNVFSRLILHYGGESGLTVESTQGKGTTVTLTICYNDA